MTKLIDTRTSMGINATIEDAEIIPTKTPVLVGQVGLNVPSDTPGIIRVKFDGVVGIQLPIKQQIEVSEVTLAIVNGVLPTAPIVYRSQSNYDINFTNYQLIPVSASAYNISAPANGLLVYSLYLFINNGNIQRSGPESFNASVYSDD